jgi:heterotetrameric sarcosine oxidase gamma subunit
MKLQSRSVFGATFGESSVLSESGAGEKSSTHEPATGTFATETVLLERADIGGVLVNSTRDALMAVAELRAAMGLWFPHDAGAITEDPLCRILWLTPRSWLIQCSVADESMLTGRINAVYPDKSVHAVLFGDYLCWLELCGPYALDLLSEGGFLSLEPGGLAVGHAKRTVLAGVAVVLLRERVETWLIGVERSRAVYIANWLRARLRRSRSCA